MLAELEHWRRLNWVRLCAVCDKPFGWGKNGDEAIYCGRACAGLAVGSKPRKSEKLKTYECGTCKKSFSCYHKERAYCSRLCSSEARKGRKMRRAGAGRMDMNQGGIVAALRSEGASVLITANLGCGFPDLIVGYRLINVLMEVKNPKNSYGRRGLNKNQTEWAADWLGGPIVVASDIEGALRVLRVIDACGGGRAAETHLAKIASAGNVLMASSILVTAPQQKESGAPSPADPPPVHGWTDETPTSAQSRPTPALPVELVPPG